MKLFCLLNDDWGAVLGSMLGLNFLKKGGMIRVEFIVEKSAWMMLTKIKRGFLLLSLFLGFLKQITRWSNGAMMFLFMM